MNKNKSNLDNEIYFLRKIKEGKFSVSEKGIVRNLHTDRTIGAVNSSGYYKICDMDYSIKKRRHSAYRIGKELKISAVTAMTYIRKYNMPYMPSRPKIVFE